MSENIVLEIKAQFQRQWKTVRDLVEKVPDEQWDRGDIDYLVPARQFYHIVSSADIYANFHSYEEHKPHRKFTKDWESEPADQLPNRQMALRYIDEMEKAVTDWLDGLGDDGLLREEASYTWTGTKKLGRALYLLRHTQNHVGELNSELRRRGLPRGKW